MKISDDVRRFAKERGLDTAQAVEEGMGEKAEEFRRGGSELYVASGESR